MRLAAILPIMALWFFAAASDAQQPGKGKVDPKKADPPEPKYNMKLSVANILIGTYVMGPKIAKDDLKGRVVLVDYWGIDCEACLKSMPATAALYNELADFGLVVIGSHRQEGTPEKITAAAKQRAIPYSISNQTHVEGSQDNRFIPHSLLFDHTGACIFRGAPSEMETPVRIAVGKALVAGAEREKFTSALKPIVQDLSAGKPPLSVLPRLIGMQNAKGDVGADANALLASLTASGQKKLDRAADVVDKEPLEAFLLLEKLPTAYKGTAVAKKANEMLVKLRKEKPVTAELAARPALEMVRSFEQQLASRFGANDPKKPDFQKTNAALLKQLKDKVQQMNKAWPDAKSTQEAVAIAEKYGVAPK